jgi:hypothetical protein
MHVIIITLHNKYKGCFQSSGNHLITPSRNFVEVRWRSLFRSTSLGKRCTSYNAPPTSRKRAADRWSLRNFLSGSPEIAWGEIWIEFCVRLGKLERWNPIRTSAIQSRSLPMRFLGFSNHEKGALRQEISKWSTVCSKFSRSGWSVVRSASLAKGGTSKTRPSPHLHKFRLGVIRWVHELFKRFSYNSQSHWTRCLSRIRSWSARTLG